MRYQDLRTYAGPKTACDHCKRSFRVGQVIHVNQKHGLVFCESNSDEPNLCMQNYLFRKFSMTNPGEMLMTDLYVFGHHTDLSVEPKQQSLFSRLLQLFCR